MAKKIALCLSGQPRSVELAFPYVKNNILGGNDVTVFTFSWGKDNQNILDLYKPALSIVREQNVIPDFSQYTRFPPPQPNWKVKDPARSTWNQLYAIKVCNDFKKAYENHNNMKFDWVIRSRYEIGRAHV